MDKLDTVKPCRLLLCATASAALIGLNGHIQEDRSILLKLDPYGMERPLHYS